MPSRKKAECFAKSHDFLVWCIGNAFPRQCAKGVARRGAFALPRVKATCPARRAARRILGFANRRAGVGLVVGPRFAFAKQSVFRNRKHISRILKVCDRCSRMSRHAWLVPRRLRRGEGPMRASRRSRFVNVVKRSTQGRHLASASALAKESQRCTRDRSQR